MPRETPIDRPLDVAQHEAAHVVVGVALGLRMRRAVLAREVLPRGWVSHGWVWFDGGPRRLEALNVMTAAGVAWERAVGGRGDAHDWRDLRASTSGLHGAEACVRCARALLFELAPEHERVTRALLERDLTGADIAAIARGETITAED